MTTKYVFCDTYQMVYLKLFEKIGKLQQVFKFQCLLSKKGLTMPLTVAQTKDRQENLVSGGGHKQATLQRRQKAAEDFDHFIQ